MGQKITLTSSNEATGLDTDQFSASLRDEGYPTNEASVHGNTVTVTISNSLMDDQFADDDVREELLDTAVKVADTFDLKVISAGTEQIVSES